MRQGQRPAFGTFEHSRHLDQTRYWKTRHDELEQRCQDLERRNVQLERWRLSDAADAGQEVILIEDEPRSRSCTPRPRTPRPSTPRPSTPAGIKRKATGSTPARSPKKPKHSSSDAAELSLASAHESDKSALALLAPADDEEVDRARELLLQKLHVAHKLYRWQTANHEAICFSVVETARAIGALVALIPRNYDKLAMGNLKGIIPVEKDRSELSAVIQTCSRAWGSLIVGLEKISGENGNHLPSLVVYECVKMFKTILDSLSPAARQIAHSRFANQSKSSKERGDCATTARDTGPFRAVAQFVNAAIGNLRKENQHHRDIFEGVLFLILEQVGKLLFYFTFDRQRGATIEDDITVSPAEDDMRNIPRKITENIATRLEAQCLISMLDRAMGVAPHHMNNPLASRPSSSSSRRASGTGPSTPTKSLPRSKVPLVSWARDRLQRTLIQCMFGDQDQDEFADVLRMPGTLGPLPRFPKLDEGDVGDWFNGEVWKLIGWELLSKDSVW